MSQPITLYSPDGKRSREIAAIDVPGWLRSGWSLEPVVLVPQIISVPENPAESTPVATKSKAKPN